MDEETINKKYTKRYVETNNSEEEEDMSSGELNTNGYVANAMYDNIRGMGYGYGYNQDMKMHDLERDLLKGNDYTHQLIADKYEKLADKIDNKYDKLDSKIEKVSDKVSDCCCKTQEAIAGLANAMKEANVQSLYSKQNETYSDMLYYKGQCGRKN